MNVFHLHLSLGSEDQIKSFEEEFKLSNIWVHQEFFKERKYLWKKRIKIQKNIQSDLNLSESEKKLFKVIFELVYELIRLRKLDYSKKLLDYENEYKNLSDKFTIYKLRRYIKFALNKIIIKTIITLNKYLDKFLLN